MVAFIFLGLALIGSGHEPPMVLPECSDGVDNEGDGDFDFQDQDCYAFVSFGDIGEPDNYQYCPNWDDETNPPTLADCN